MRMLDEDTILGFQLKISDSPPSCPILIVYNSLSDGKVVGTLGRGWPRCYGCQSLRLILSYWESEPGLVVF
jgi:hypothetical protein